MAISHREKKWCDQAYCVLTFCIVKALQGAMDRMSLKSRRYVSDQAGQGRNHTRCVRDSQPQTQPCGALAFASVGFGCAELRCGKRPRAPSNSTGVVMMRSRFGVDAVC